MTVLAEKPAKPARVILVDGHRVVLTSVEPKVAAARDRHSDGVERSRYRVEVDGVHRGHIVYIKSWYGSWEALSLGALARNSGPQRLNSVMSLDGTPYQPPNRDDLARQFPGWIAAGRAPCLAELAAFRASDGVVREREAQEAAREREAAEIRRAELRETLRARDAAERNAMAERLAVLDGLRARGAQVLSNAEIDALAWAIEQLAGTRS